MDDKKDVQESLRGRTRIQYVNDVESRAGSHRGQTTRGASRSSSMSIRTISRNHTVDPGLVLPTHYRTLSIRVEESKIRDAEGDKTGRKGDIDFADIVWHKLSVQEILLRLSSSPTQGLSNEQVAKRLKQHGPNRPTQPSSRCFQRILGYLFGGFGPILFIAAILVFVAWKPLEQPPQQSNLALAIVLICVFFAQAAFSFYQGVCFFSFHMRYKIDHGSGFVDFSSSRVMASIKTMLPDHCLVFRDGARQNIPGADIVPGDLLCIKMGDRLPADVRFIEVSTDARFDRAILTGETAPLHGCVDSTDDNYLETACIGLAGTHCVVGSTLGLVVATGDRTVFGRIAKLTAPPKQGQTSLQREIFHFVKIVVGMMLSMIFVVLIVWAAWLRRSHPTWISVPQLIVDCVTIAVAFVPEGLPIAVTSSLTITASIMKRNKILCKSLQTVETLGSVSVICSDKTGTLTEVSQVLSLFFLNPLIGFDVQRSMRGVAFLGSSPAAYPTSPSHDSLRSEELPQSTANFHQNQMTVTECMVGRCIMTAAQAAKAEGAGNDGPEELGIMGGLCNASEFDATTMDQPLKNRKINGDATDQAILRFAESIVPVSETRRQFKTIYKIAFNSKNKFMVQIVQSVGLSRLDTSSTDPNSLSPLLLTIKGAPDILIARCNAVMADNGKYTRPITQDDRNFVEETKNQWSSQGRRVILLARKKLPVTMRSLSTASLEYEQRTLEEASKELEFVGLVAILDPPRDEIPQVIETLRGAGIRVFMVTGDFKLTALAIAVQCGIITQPEAVDDAMALSSDDRSSEPPVSAAEKGVQVLGSRGIALSGVEINQLGGQEWDSLCNYQEIVFARTTPEQKLRIVKEFQARGKVVGMTGDGVNDAPSLKAADIGIAMGSGSEVAMEAADMVLLDSFSAIIEAIKYGRVVFDNLKKTICYLMRKFREAHLQPTLLTLAAAGTFSEFWPIFTNVLFGMPQILSSFLMIIICCFTDCAAATVIAYERPERDVLARKPRNMKKDRLVNGKLFLQAYGFLGTVMALCSFAVSYWHAERKGILLKQLVLGFGRVPNGMSQAYFTKVLDESSSIYFINLVIM
ncbi:MAG: hypothetical protein Q9157_000075 [Trypethelium eluteriae]